MGRPKILVLRGGAIGDFVMTLPVLQALRERWPEAHVELLGYPHIAGLARDAGLADTVRSLEQGDVARLFVPESPLPEALAAHLRTFDLAISFLYDPDDAVRTSLAAAGVRQVLTADPRPAGMPAARHLLKPLEALALYPEGEPYPRIRLPAAAMARGRGRLGEAPDRTVVVHPGSGSPSKNWPLGRFLEIAKRLRASGFSVCFSFGEADADVRLAFECAVVGYPVMPPLPLTAWAETVGAACGYLGNDSGVTHVAAALGLPVTAIFGPSNPEVWGSRAPGVRVVRADPPTPEGLAALPVESVWASVQTMLGGAAGSGAAP